MTIVAAADDTIVYHNTILDYGSTVDAVNGSTVVTGSSVGNSES